MQVFWILLSCLLFATMSMFIKLASAQFSLAEILFFRTLPGVVILVAFARLRQLPLQTRHWRVHALRGVVGIGSMVLGFYAVSQLSLGTTACLEYTAPIFMVLYVLVLTRQRPGAVELFAIFGGFAGVLLLLRPSVHEGQLVPFMAGLGSGALAAIAYFQLRRLGGLGEAPWRTVLIYTVIAMLVSLVAMTFTARSVYTPHGVALLAGIGGTGLIAQLAMTRAFSQGSPTVPATLQYSTLIFASLYGYLVWGDVLTWTSATGLVFILLSGSLAALAVRDARTVSMSDGVVGFEQERMRRADRPSRL
jgi:drug/metabolite transporter (DMT)-like permease